MDLPLIILAVAIGVNMGMTLTVLQGLKALRRDLDRSEFLKYQVDVETSAIHSLLVAMARALCPQVLPRWTNSTQNSPSMHTIVSPQVEEIRPARVEEE